MKGLFMWFQLLLIVFFKLNDMKNKYLLYWFLLQLVFVFITTGFLVNGEPGIAGNLFVFFMIQSLVFLVVLLYSKRKWFLK